MARGLPGLLLLGVAGDSFEISTLLNNADAIRQHSFYVPMLILILVGAFTKSAQFPFHFWLPNALAAQAFYKGGLFMPAGAVDHAAHLRHS